MKARDLKALTPTQLRSQARELMQELAAARAAVRHGKEKNHAKLAQLKRDVARVHTILNQQENL